MAAMREAPIDPEAVLSEAEAARYDTFWIAGHLAAH